MRCVGIDLAGSSKRKTGFSLLTEDFNCIVRVLYTDREIIRNTLDAEPDVVCIDAPLFLPRGKKDFRQRGPPHLRKCDIELKKMGIKFFPITLGPMRKLTRRGIVISKILKNHGINVYESFPGAAQDILGIPRKNYSTELLFKALRSAGVKIVNSDAEINGDTLDAITLSIVGMMYLNGIAMKIGSRDEGYMLLPKCYKDGKES